jgi:hypothetical protein
MKANEFYRDNIFSKREEDTGAIQAGSRYNEVTLPDKVKHDLGKTFKVGQTVHFSEGNGPIYTSEIVAIRDGLYIFLVDGKAFAVPHENLSVADTRTDQEKGVDQMLNDWTHDSLDNIFDNLQSEARLGDVFEVLYKLGYKREDK